MELSKKGLNSNNDGITETQNKLLYKNVQKSSTKKKFCNTVFAAKMRNRRKEEKLKNLNGKDVLTSCKLVSVDVTRLSSKVVPKLISTVQHRNRKRKRFQWRLGIMKKKKKARDKNDKINKANKKDTNMKDTVIDSNVTESDNVHTEKKTTNKEKSETDKLELSIDKDDIQRRKSTRHVTPLMFFDEKRDIESKPDVGLVSQEIFSCRRVEPFIGKLCTKEARILNVEKILNEEDSPIGKIKEGDKVKDSEENNEIDNIKKIHPVSETDQSKHTESTKDSKTVENSSNDAIIESNESKTYKNKDYTNSLANTLKTVAKEVNNQGLKKLSKIDVQAKENIAIEESACRRTMPFVGKHPRKLKPGASEMPIEIDCCSDSNIKSNPSLEQVNEKLDCSSTDKNFKLNSSTKVHTESEIFKDTSLNCPSKNTLKDTYTKLVNTSIDHNTLDSSITNTELNIPKGDLKLEVNSPLKMMESKESNILLQNDIKLHSSQKCVNAKDINKNLEIADSKIQNVNYSSNNIDLKSVCLNNDANIKPGKNTVTNETEEIWSCRRTELYLGKEYPNCSRTLPFVRPLNKQKTSNTPGTNVEINTSENVLQRRASNSLSSSEDNQSIEKLKQNINTETPINQEINVNNTDMDNTDNLVNSKMDIPIHNGEWKFRRKRQTMSHNEAQEGETKYSKKPKIKSSPESKPSPEKLSSAVLSPERTICSLFSLNCMKHAHHHTNNDECAVSVKIKKDAYVLLTKLEKMTDPLVVDYFKKIDYTYSIKKDVVSPFKNNFINDELSTNLDNELLDNPYTNSQKQSTKDDHSIISNTILDKDGSDSQSSNIQDETESSNNEFQIKSNSKIRRRTISGISSDSSGIIYAKRKKRPVNYLEIFSDSDSDNSTYSSTKIRSQSRGPVLRKRIRNKKCIQDSDENDKEVEEFSYIGLSSRNRNKNDVCSDQDRVNTDNNCHAEVKENNLTQYKSMLKQSINKETSKSPKRTKSPSVGFPNNQSEKLIWTQDHNEQNKTDNTISKEVEEFSSNSVQLRPHNAGPGTDLCKTPSFSEQRSEIDAEQMGLLRTPSISYKVSTTRMLSTPKTINKNEDVAHSENELHDTPKKLANTPSRIDRGSPYSSSRSDTPLRSIKRIKNNLLAKLNKSKLNSELLSNIHKPINPDSLDDLKVQLIRLETICQDFEDYSASEIELLTRKYIDLLMNSNFTCDTWRTPINYHRSEDFVENDIDQVDSSDYISDIETHEVQKSVHVETTNNSIATKVIEYVVEETSGNNRKERTTTQCDDESLTSLETAIATLVDGEVLEERNFGAVNISDALNVTSNNRNKEPAVLTVELSEEERRSENQDQQGCSAVLVNGIKMFSCSFCNKIFTDAQLFNNHMKADHNFNKASASTISSTTPKPNEKQACKTGSSSTKRQTAIKSKRKSTCSDNLMCTICSVTFDTKELLFDHIMTHNEQELQEAYKHAKAKKKQLDADHRQSLESDKEQDESNKTEFKRKSIDSNIRSSRSSIESDEITIENVDGSSVITTLPITHSDEQQQQTLDRLDKETRAALQQSYNMACNKPITICTCHAHETTNQDLQIEMVLLCKTCNVIYRRRDCFEVHFRTSPECRRKRTNNEVLKVPKLFCSGCPCMLDSLTDMRSHLEMHAKKNCHGTVTFICNICKVAFFGVGGIFYSHWFNHMKAPNFVASRYSFPKLSVVSVLEDANVAMATSKSQEGFFYIAEHVCRQCRLPFSSEPELQKHELTSCQPQQPNTARSEVPENNRLQMIKLICDLCKKYYVSKENFDRHCSERNHLKTPITKFSRLPINNNEQAFVCSLCRSISKSLDDMKEHWKRIHSPIMELYTCKTCNIVPSNDVANYTYEKFGQHCRSSHKSEVITCLVYFVTARYVCSICKFGFETEESMKEHQVVHEKQSSQVNTINLPPLLPKMNPGLPPEPQTATLWVADKEVAPDGGRLVHPVYVHYPGVRGSDMQRQILPKPAPLNVQNHQQLQIRTPGQLNTSVVANLITSNFTNSDNAMLRQMLNQKPCDGPRQQPQQQSSSRAEDIETIFIDSRSNSPILDAAATINTNDKTITDNQETAATANSGKKSYMTIVNPDFESMLGSKANAQIPNNNIHSLPNTEDSNSRDGTTLLDMDSLTPQPFEVVLVTDDLNENSNSEIPITTNELVLDPATQNINSSVNLNQQAPVEMKESSSIKSLIRVRSVAELQRIQIHLCSVCGLSFDTFQALEQHSQQHDTNSLQTSNDVGRSTPVQMISPMISQGNKEIINNPQTLVADQMKQKFSIRMSSGQEISNNTDLNNRVNSSILANQLQQQQSQQPQQQQQAYWFASCNGTEKSPVLNTNYGYNVNHQKQQPQPNLQRRPVNTNNVNSLMSGNQLRGAPPPYSQIANPAMPVRSSSIQLPERNTAGNSTPTTKRPSGAATRIPQQSLPSFEELTQGVSPHWSYAMGAQTPSNSTSSGELNHGSSSVNSRLMPNIISRPQMPQLQTKTYSRLANNFTNYPTTTNSPNYQKVTYTCKVQGCGFRSENPVLIRNHEKSHFIQQQSQNMQQQRLPMKHVPVSQMPERPRHAIPTLRPPNPGASDKRLMCRICNLFCTSAAELLEHVNSTHGGTPANPATTTQPTVANRVCCYVCDYCPTPLLFESEELLRKHMNATHNFSCDICSKRYPSKIDLMMHKEIHARNT